MRLTALTIDYFCFHVHFLLSMYENSYIHLTPKKQFQEYDVGQHKGTSISQNFLLNNLQLIFIILTVMSIEELPDILKSKV